MKEFTAMRDRVCNFASTKIKAVVRAITVELSKAKKLVCDNLSKVSPSGQVPIIVGYSLEAMYRHSVSADTVG